MSNNENAIRKPLPALRLHLASLISSILSPFPARHTSADWTNPNVTAMHPDLEKATANVVTLRAGEALYVPEYWILSIVDMGISTQCNRCVRESGALAADGER